LFSPLLAQPCSPALAKFVFAAVFLLLFSALFTALFFGAGCGAVCMGAHFFIFHFHFLCCAAIFAIKL
jgi:hypothetical protein